jgi:glycosyltransferase involved in cell wall biosynthesis
MHAPDLVHLHWVGRGVLPLRSLPRFPCPLVWTLHDMGPITGGCHHSFECNSYQDGCGTCPQLSSKRKADLSYRNMVLRKKVYGASHMHFVAPSNWMAQRAGLSDSACRVPISVISPDLNSEIFKPIDRRSIRKEMGIGEDEIVILLIGHGGLRNPHKGWSTIPLVLAGLLKNDSLRKYRLLLVGGNKNDSDLVCPDVITQNIGFVDDEAVMAKYYAASTLLLFPSEAETFGMVALEAIACGRPVAAYPVGGIPEVVIEAQTGSLAVGKRPEDLTAAVIRILNRQADEWVKSCRDFFEEKYPRGRFVKAHINLYKQMLGSSKS